MNISNVNGDYVEWFMIKHNQFLVAATFNLTGVEITNRSYYDHTIGQEMSTNTRPLKEFGAKFYFLACT